MLNDFLKSIDLYGKSPELYYKGKSNKTTWVGRILTILYVIIYVAFLIYKLNRMVKRVDVTFYDTNAYTGEIPSIHLNKENFYGGFAFDIPTTDIPYNDERIYTIEGKIVSQIKSNGEVNVTERPVSFRQCRLSDFGSKYQKILENKNVERMLCPMDVDFVLEGYNTLDRYSYIKMNFKRCVNSTENNFHCYPNETLLQYLSFTTIDSIIQDVDLTPQNHDKPVQELERYINGPTYKDLHQRIYVYMQLVIIETDDNIIGFEALSNTKVEKHLKYETSWVISSPNVYGDFMENPYADLNDITLQLSPTVLTQKRTYVQLIDVLGDVGGLMEIVNMIFSIICSFISGILYEETLVNNLFGFDLDKRLIILKNNKKNINKDNITMKSDIKTIDKNISNIENDNKNKISPKNINENNNNKDNNNNILILKKSKIKPRTKKNSSSRLNIEIHSKEEKQSKDQLNSINEEKENNLIDINSAMQEKSQENNMDESIDKELIKKINNPENNIKLNRFFVHCGFCCVRSVSNVNNILLDEGMKLITEQLDIFNMFRKLYIESKREKQMKEKTVIVNMSNESKKNLEVLMKDLNNPSEII